MKHSLKSGLGLCAVPLLALGGLAVSARPAAAAVSYTFTDIVDPTPGVVQTIVTGISDNGEMVGYSSTSTEQGINGTDVGFLDDNGSFSDVDNPSGTTNDNPAGINNSGQISGTYLNANSITQGFVDDSSGQFTAITDPNDSTADVNVYGINNSGDFPVFIVGSSFSNSIENTDGTSTPFPGPSGALYVNVGGISNNGLVVGNYLDSSNTEHGFIDDNGSFTNVDGPGANLTLLNGVNNSGEIIGFYDTGVAPIYFTDTGGDITVISDPNSTTDSTSILGINDAGDLVGSYVNQAGDTVGFLAVPNASPAPEPSQIGMLGLMGLALGGLMLKARKKRIA